MAIQQHKTGGFRAYKKIGGVEYQLYSFDRTAAVNLQAMLDEKKPNCQKPSHAKTV